MDPQMGQTLRLDFVIFPSRKSVATLIIPNMPERTKTHPIMTVIAVPRKSKVRSWLATTDKRRAPATTMVMLIMTIFLKSLTQNPYRCVNDATMTRITTKNNPPMMVVRRSTFNDGST